jgi:hypothetical protein
MSNQKHQSQIEFSSDFVNDPEPGFPGFLEKSLPKDEYL